MEKHRITVLIVILAAAMVLLSACRAGGAEPEKLNVEINLPKESVPEKDADADKPATSGPEQEGMLYKNENHQLSVFINNPEWIYTINPKSGVIYFVNENDENGDGLISMSGYEFDGDPLETVEWRWEQMKAAYEGEEGFRYEDMETIEINGGITGYHFRYEMSDERGIIYWTTTWWNVDEIMYTCISSAVNGSEEVESVLQGIFDSFQRIESAPGNKS